jgi:hypothetical protein
MLTSVWIGVVAPVPILSIRSDDGCLVQVLRTGSGVWGLAGGRRRPERRLNLRFRAPKYSGFVPH